MSEIKNKVLKDLKSGALLTVRQGSIKYNCNSFKDIIFVLRKTNTIKDFWSVAISGKRFKTYYMEVGF
jgi:predicted DNA-binding ArsR family transcriptional regulator